MSTCSKHTYLKHTSAVQQPTNTSQPPHSHNVSRCWKQGGKSTLDCDGMRAHQARCACKQSCQNMNYMRKGSQFICRHVIASSLLVIKCGGSDLEIQHNFCNCVAHRSLLKHLSTHTGHELVDLHSKDRLTSPQPHSHTKHTSGPEWISRLATVTKDITLLRQCCKPVVPQVLLNPQTQAQGSHQALDPHPLACFTAGLWPQALRLIQTSGGARQ